MSVTDIRKNYPLSLKPCPKVPFLRPPSLIRLPQSTSEECSTGLVNKTYSRGTCLWVKWKAAFAWVKLPSQENKHSYNLCARLRSTASGPVWSGRPRSREPTPRVSAHQEHFLYVFTENMRGIHLLVNSQSEALKVSGDQAVGISGRQIGVSLTPRILGANPLTKPGELSLIRLFTITRKTNIINKLYHNYRATAEARSFPSKCLAF